MALLLRRPIALSLSLSLVCVCVCVCVFTAIFQLTRRVAPQSSCGATVDELRHRLLRRSAIGDEVPQLERFYTVPFYSSFERSLHVAKWSSTIAINFILGLTLRLAPLSNQ